MELAPGTNLERPSTAFSAPRCPSFSPKTREPAGGVIRRPGFEVCGRNRVEASDLLGAYLAGHDSLENSHLQAGRPLHGNGARKTIRPLGLVGHVLPLASR
jgi:hypothetical protein